MSRLLFSPFSVGRGLSTHRPGSDMPCVTCLSGSVRDVSRASKVPSFV